VHAADDIFNDGSSAKDPIVYEFDMHEAIFFDDFVVENIAKSL